MVLTRSMEHTAIVNMNMSDSNSTSEISDAVKLYLSTIINNSAEELKTEISLLRTSVESKNKQISDLQSTTASLKVTIDELKSTVNEKNDQISALNIKVVEVVRRSVLLSSKLAESHDSLSNSIDDLEQYGRKNSLRVEGIEVSQNETNADLTIKVAKALNSLGAKVTSTDFFRLHRSSGSRTTKDGRVVSQCIVKFNSWAARSRAYGTRFIGTRTDRLKKPYFVRLDLTRRRLDLLMQAQNLLEDHPTTHAFADSECKLAVKNRDTEKKWPFNTAAELNAILSSIGAPTMPVPIPIVSLEAPDAQDEIGSDDRGMAALWASR